MANDLFSKRDQVRMVSQATVNHDYTELQASLSFGSHFNEVYGLNTFSYSLGAGYWRVNNTLIYEFEDGEELYLFSVEV